MKIERRVYLGVPGAVLAGLILFTYLSYRHDIRAAEARVSSGSQIVDTPCGSIEYAVIGKGAPVLIVHGAGGGFDQGLEFGRPFAQAGFTAISVSRFGYLRTPLPANASPAAQADAYACLLDALKLPQAAILGVSAGAPSTLQFCLRHAKRCSAMVLLVPAIAAPRPAGEVRMQPPAFARFVMNAVLGSDFANWAISNLSRGRMVEMFFGTPYADFRRAAPQEQERLLRIVRQVAPVSQRVEGVQNDFAVLVSPPRIEPERIAAPTLVVSAANDLFGTYASGRDLAARIPGAQFSGFADGGHLLAGHYASVMSEIAAFLKKAAQGTPPRTR